MQKHLKDYFVPHEGNNYKPHSLQKVALLGMCCLILLSFAVANIQSMLWLGSQWMISTVLPAVIVDLTNDERTDASLGNLRRSSVLDEAARLKAQDMAKNEYFAHYSPTGVSPWHWFGEASYNFVHAGENLAVHFTDSGDVVQAWMDSPTHRANIMNGNYTEIGVGTAEGTYEGFKTVYVVQLFGTPAVASVAGVEEAPESEVPTEPETVVALAEEETPSTGETEVLSDSVELSQTVEFIEDEPEIVVASSTEKETSTTTEIVEIQTTYHGVAFYSDFMATSTGSAVAGTADPEVQSDSRILTIAGIATKPHMVLQILYTIIALIVCLSLLTAIVIEVKRQHPVELAYTVALLLLMFGLFQLHIQVSGGALIV